MKSIPITGGGVALVDDEDFPLLSRFHWFAVLGTQTTYAGRNYQIGVGAKNRRVVPLLMHRLLYPCDPGCVIDHRDGNGLNNQKANLRLATTTQNAQNMKVQLRNKTSRFKGVSFNKRLNKWHAYIKVSAKRTHIGFFDTEDEAARAYDHRAIISFGAYARPNFPEAVHV